VNTPNSDRTTQPPTAELVAFDQSQVQFLRKMGHDLRTPLNSIIGTAELMLNGLYGELTPRQHTGTERILNNSDRLLLLIDALMTFIRASADALHLESVPISVQALTDSAMKHSNAAQARDTKLSVVLGDNMPATVQGDPDYLPRLLDELILNAIAATVNGKIEVQFVGCGEAEWQIIIIDNGIGLAPDVLANAFQPFWRSAEFKKFNPNGRGLGLPIAYELVRMMTGSMLLESNVDTGACVKVRLPRVMPECLTDAMLSGISRS